MYVLKDRTEILKFCHRMLTVFCLKTIEIICFSLTCAIVYAQKV